MFGIKIFYLHSHFSSHPFLHHFLQTYSTGRTNVLLTMVSILQWIGNAMMYAVVVCLMSYNVLFPTFYNLDLYRAGENTNNVVFDIFFTSSAVIGFSLLLIAPKNVL